jgi:hypothetical protein
LLLTSSVNHNNVFVVDKITKGGKRNMIIRVRLDNLVNRNSVVTSLEFA